MSIRFRFQKKYIAFLTIMPLLTVISLFQVDCPVCGGDGSLASSPPMKNVEITDWESKEISVTREICDEFLAYKYDLMLTLKNNGTEDAEGWIKLILRDFSQGKVLDIRYLGVAIPGESAIEATYTVWFSTGLDVPGKTEIHAEVVAGEVPDETCNGSGKVSLNIWLLANGFKEAFQEVVRAHEEYKPPVWYPPETEGGGWAE